MKNKIKFLGNGDEMFKGEIHFSAPSGNDYTLCGLTLDMDTKTCGDFENTSEKVNCTKCQEIVDYCKSIRKTW
ncbi:MAG: hypothetical protein PHT69_02755 [Bacteroidales bacterium]|nr:hypothetical protein [Bacteroidales bacterium]